MIFSRSGKADVGSLDTGDMVQDGMRWGRDDCMVEVANMNYRMSVAWLVVEALGQV